MIAPGAGSGSGAKRARVLVVGPVPPPAHGCAVIIRNMLASSLTERFELLHLDTSDRRGLENIGRLDAGNVWRAGVHGTRFLRMLASQRPDLVYITLAQNTWGFLRDALFLSPTTLRRTCCVVHFQSGQFDTFYDSAQPPVRQLVRMLLPRVDRAVVLGHTFTNMLDGLVSRDRIDVVPNAVPDPGLVQRDRSGRRVRALYLGNLIPSKGYIDVVHAARDLTREGVDIDWVIAGGVSDPDAHQRALDVARELGDRIRFTGPVDDAAKAKLLADADMLVFPSRYENEGLPLVLLEAMAAGLPVVSTYHAAIPEVVQEGVTGLLVQPGDVAALTAAIRRLAFEADMRRGMGAAARARFLEEYTVARWSERMAAVFDTALGVHAA